MIKTIATLTQTTPTLPADSIVQQCAIWENQGKYTGGTTSMHNPTTGARRVERWAWINNDAAETYKNFIISTWIDLYPDVNVDIVVE